MKNFLNLNKYGNSRYKTRCKCIENVPIKQRIYYIDETPFFLHNYQVTEAAMKIQGNNITMSSDYGSFAYL